jgi:hypothetical protein
MRAPPRHRPASFRDPPAACGAATGARRARAAARLAGGARAAALRFLPLRAGQPRAAARDRAPGQSRDPREPHRRDPHHGAGRRQGIRRHGAVRREVRRAGARAAHGRLLHRAVRRHPCARVGDIGLFKITPRAASAPASAASRPCRRARAGPGSRTRRRARAHRRTGQGLRRDADDKVAQLVERNRKLEKELEQLKAKLASAAGSDLADQVVEVDGVKVLAARLDGADPSPCVIPSISSRTSSAPASCCWPPRAMARSA